MSVPSIRNDGMTPRRFAEPLPPVLDNEVLDPYRLELKSLQKIPQYIRCDAMRECFKPKFREHGFNIFVVSVLDPSLRSMAKV